MNKLSVFHRNDRNDMDVLSFVAGSLVLCWCTTGKDRMKDLCLVVLLFWVIVAGTSEENSGKPCVIREYGKGEKVCVCNATHCDTIDPLPPFPSRMFNMYTSSKDGLRFFFGRKKFVPWVNPKSVKVKVNSSKIYQGVIGFGGSLSDAATLNINALSENTKDNLIRSYFSKEGLEYNLLRVTIGSSDHSVKGYSLAETPEDFSLIHFKLSHEDITYKIPDLKKITEMSTKEILLVATAWSAPPWMKTNDDYKGNGVLKDEYYDLWSKYHLKFLEEFDKYGLPIWALTTGYQPSTGLVPFYPYNCMGWTPFSQSQWISENLGPDLENSKYNKTKIIAMDDVRFFLPLWPKLMFNNKKTKAYVSGIGVQWYWDFIMPPRLLDLTHMESPEKFILGTEASFNRWKGALTTVALGLWNRAEDYIESIIEDFNHWVSGWMDSNLALDLKGGPTWVDNVADAAIIVNKTADEFYKQPMFYALGHFSKFVPKDSVRIEVEVSKSGVKATGFRTPQGNVVLVLLNKKTHDVPVTILGALKGNANIPLKKKSIMTIIYRDKKKFSHPKVTF